MEECLVCAIWNMGQGPGACTVDLAPHAKLCVWSEFTCSERQKKTTTNPHLYRSNHG